METKTKTIHKLIPLIAAACIQICVGTAYIWSVFQTGIAESLFNGDNAKASLSFSILLAVISVGGIIGGKLEKKFSTKVVIILGGIILSAGFFLASLTSPKFPYLIWITYGIMGGIGMGFTYSTSIACAQKWFPENKGLVTGIIVSALGFGGVILTPFIESLIKTFGGQGKGELKSLMVLSILFLIVCTLGGLCMKNPPQTKSINLNNNTITKKQFTAKEVLKSPSFYLLTTTMMIACMSGLMMIGFAKPFAIGKGLAELATISVLLISISNAAGRLVFGIISDKIGQIKTIKILLIGTAVLAIIVSIVNGAAILIIIGLIGFFYGGILGVFPSLTAELFGAKNMSINYSLVLIGFGVGAVASSYIAGYYKNLATTDITLMNPAFYIASACTIVGLILISLVSKQMKQTKAKENA